MAYGARLQKILRPHVDPAGPDFPDEARRRGIGRALMEAAMAEARARGKRVLTLNTGEGQVAAIAMYEAMGFIREPDNVFPDGVRLMSYRLPLD